MAWYAPIVGSLVRAKNAIVSHPVVHLFSPRMLGKKKRAKPATAQPPVAAVDGATPETPPPPGSIPFGRPTDDRPTTPGRNARVWNDAPAADRKDISGTEAGRVAARNPTLRQMQSFVERAKAAGLTQAIRRDATAGDGHLAAQGGVLAPTTRAKPAADTSVPGGGPPLNLSADQGADVAVHGGATTPTSADAARADHKHELDISGSAWTVTPQSVGAANSAGTSTKPARADHVHQGSGATPYASVPATVAPNAETDANCKGVSSDFARGDHRHRLKLTDTEWDLPYPGDVQATGGHSKGTSNDPARADHKHAIDLSTADFTAIPAPAAIGPSASAGSSPYPARADHVHINSVTGAALSDGTPQRIKVSDSAGGSSGEAARLDHKHSLCLTDSDWASAIGTNPPAALKPSTDTPNFNIGGSPYPARADHQHPGGINASAFTILTGASAGSGQHEIVFTTASLTFAAGVLSVKSTGSTISVTLLDNDACC